MINRFERSPTCQLPLGNATNLGFVILFLVILGCSCPKLGELTGNRNSSAPSSSTTPEYGNSTKDGQSSDLTLEKYNRVRNGMTYEQVADILGQKGTESFNSKGATYQVISYTWSGDNFEFVSVTFTNNKVSSKTQANLK